MKQKILLLCELLFIASILTLVFSQTVSATCIEEGGTGSPNEITCCEGLKAYGNYKINSDGDCIPVIEYGKHLVCINCGNNICGLGENVCNCPTDCIPSNCINTCGNGVCDESPCQGPECSCPEKASNCPQDCAHSEPICDKDGKCESPPEDQYNCPEDCINLSDYQIASRIIPHAYSLMDLFIEQLPQFTCNLTSGSFSFTLNDNTLVSFTPGCMNNQIWRIMTFANPDGRAGAIFLDGPITAKSGTPNPEAIEQAKNALATSLSDSNKTVKRIMGNDVVLDLSSEDKIREFNDYIYNYINISVLPSTGPEPASATILEGTQIEINPAKDPPLEIENLPSSFTKIKTKIVIDEEKKEIEININSAKKEMEMKVDNEIAISDKKIEIRESKSYITIAGGQKEIKISPKAASSRATAVTKVNTIELKEESQQPIYSVKGTKQAKLLFVIPVSMQIETKVSAESGNVISIKKPWWSFLAR